MIALLAAALAATMATDAKASPLAQPGRDKALLHRHGAQLTLEKEREQEGTLRKLLALGGPAEEQAEVLTRLANLLRARALALSSQANTSDDEVSGAALRGRAKAIRDEAVARYRELVKKYPSAPRMDEALFFLADSLQEGGDDRAAVVAASELTRRFPASSWAPDAHVFVGEHFFETARLDAALAEYRAAAKVETAEVYPYALYKAAWCRFNQRAFGDAMALLKKVVEVSEARAGHKDGGDAASKVQLVREARRDYVIVYLRSGKAEGAWAEFSSSFGAPARKMLDNYARLLVDSGRDTEAQVVYGKLLELHGDLPPMAALDRARLLMIATRTGGPGKREQLLEGATAFHAALERGIAFKPNDEENKDALELAEKIGEEQLRLLSVNLHAEARKTNQEETFAAAKALYAHYLALFPKSEASYELRFFSAELHYELGEKPQAAALYEEVVRIDLAQLKAKKPAGKRLTDAAWSAVLSRDEAVGGAAEVAQKSAAQHRAEASGDAQALKPLDANEKKLAATCALYLEALPAGPKAVAVAYRLGRLEIRSKELDQATLHLEWIALSHPEHELAEPAANLILDIANLKKDFSAVHAWAVKLLAHGKLVGKRPALKATLERVEEESAYSISEGVKDDAAKAKALLAFVEAHGGKGQLLDKALFGAAAALSRAGRVDEALAARARLMKELPASELVPRAILASAADHALVGDFAEAAALSEKYAVAFRKQEDTRKWRREHPSTTKRPPLPILYDGEKARAAVHDAAVLREARGELRQALSARQLSLKTWPRGPDADEDAFSVAILRGKLGEVTGAARELAGLAQRLHGKPSLQIQSWRETAHLYTRLRQPDQAGWAWTSLERAFSRLSPKQRETEAGAAEAAAEAHLELGRKAFDEFQKQQIKAPLQTTLARKVALLKRVRKRDEDTVAMRQAGPAVCALVQLGEAQLSMSQAIEKSPMPPGLRGEQRKLYRAALEEQWKPIRDGAEETLREAEAKAREVGIGNQPCAGKARAVLEKMGAPVQAPAELALPEARPLPLPWVDADGVALPAAGIKDRGSKPSLKTGGQSLAHGNKAAQLSGEVEGAVASGPEEQDGAK